MSVALTDLLIMLSVPETLAKFQQNPRGFLDGVGLSGEEEAALLSGSLASLHARARSTNSDDPNQQFNRSRQLDPEIAVEPVTVAPSDLEVLPELEVGGPGGPEPTIGSKPILFVDREGTLLRAVSGI